MKEQKQIQLDKFMQHNFCINTLKILWLRYKSFEIQFIFKQAKPIIKAEE